MTADKELLERIEAYGFACEAGALSNCQEWVELKSASAGAGDSEILSRLRSSAFVMENLPEAPGGVFRQIDDVEAERIVKDLTAAIQRIEATAPLSATAAMPERKVVSSLYGTKEFYEATGWNACVDAVRLAAAPAPALPEKKVYCLRCAACTPSLMDETLPPVRSWMCHYSGATVVEKCGGCDCLQGMEATRTSPVVEAGTIRDAARYRWLRDEGFTRPAKMWVIGQRDMTPIVHSDLDAAIDAQLQPDMKGGES